MIIIFWHNYDKSFLNITYLENLQFVINLSVLIINKMVLIDKLTWI